MPVLDVTTPHQLLTLLIESDAKLIRLSKPLDSSARHLVVTKCAMRLFQARSLDKRLGAANEIRMAEANLKEALVLVGAVLDAPSDLLLTAP